MMCIILTIKIYCFNSYITGIERVYKDFNLCKKLAARANKEQELYFDKPCKKLRFITRKIKVAK